MPTDIEILAELERLQQLIQVAEELPREEFAKVLTTTNQADADYIEGAFIQYRRNPFAYLLTRNPYKQAIELFRVILKRMEK